MLKITHPAAKKAKKVKEKERKDWTAEQILELLNNRHKDRQWVFFPEMVFSTKAKDDKENADSRIDAWAMNLWPSRKFCRVTYEIKISRHDLLRELRKPDKRDPGLRISNQFYYVIPDGCCEVDEIPKECGLIIVKRRPGKSYGVLYTAKKAPFRTIKPELGVDFWASLARRINREEGIYEDHYNRREAQKEAKKRRKRERTTENSGVGGGKP